MDTIQLQYYLTVCREGSIAKAAEKLYISPQGLSKAIHSLEKELDVCLLERTGTRLVPTQYGHVLLEQGPSYLQAHQHILNSLAVEKGRASLILNIGVKTGFAQGLDRDFLLDFIAANPDLRVKLHAFPMPLLADAMRSPIYEVWIAPGGYDQAVFESVLQHKERMFLIVSEDHPLAHCGAVSLREVARYPLVTLPHDIGQKSLVESALSAHMAGEPQYLLDIADRDFTMRLIQRGLAVSFNSNNEYLRYPGICRVELSDLNVSVQANVLIRRDAVETEALHRFRAFAAGRTDGKRGTGMADRE